MICIDEGLAEYPISLVFAHLCQAIDQYLLADDSKTVDWRIRNHSSMSSVVHSFCALEAAINELSYFVFFDDRSEMYYAEERRTFLLRKALQNWQWTSIIEKFQIVLECISPHKSLDDTFMAELREFNSFRNLLIHGVVFKRTTLWEKHETEENRYKEADVEDKVNWRQKFPTLKFHPTDRLDPSDAKTALLLTLRGLMMINKQKHLPLILFSLHYGPHYSVVKVQDLDSKSAETILRDHRTTVTSAIVKS